MMFRLFLAFVSTIMAVMPNLSATAQRLDIRPQTVYRWVPRDPAAMWKNPDTGRVQLSTIPFGVYDGYIFSRDSNWITIATMYGQKLALRTSRIREVSDWAEVTDSVAQRIDKLHGVTITKLMYGRSPERFQALLAPMVLAGMTLPSAGATAEFNLSASVNLGFRIPGLFYNYLGEVLGLSFESRSFISTDVAYQNNDFWNIQYIALTAGLSYRGFVSAGVSLGLPISVQFLAYNQNLGDNAASNVSAVKASAANLLIEPKVVFAIPVSSYSGNLILVAEAGYPLNLIFKGIPHNNYVEFTSPVAVDQLNSIRLPQVSLGLSYAIPLGSPFRGMAVDWLE